MIRICSPHCGLAPETTSGGETYEREILLALARLGLRVELLLARGKPVPEGVANWRVHRLPIRRGLRWPVAFFLLPPYIKRIHDTVGFDVLRAHSLRFIGPAALWARRRYRLDVPVISHHHHLDPDPLNRVIERPVCLGSDAVVTVSEFSREQLTSVLGVPQEKVHVVYNGVDEKFVWRPRDEGLVGRYGLGDRPVVLFLGGLKPRKNLGFLLAVWREVMAAVPGALLLVAGTGQIEKELKGRVRDLGLDESVIFTGRVSESEKVAHYNLADVFVSVSSLEGFGLSVAEAMSCCLPVVVPRQGALPELVEDRRGGFVCEPDERDAFARRLIELLRDGPLREQFGRSNRERIDKFFRWDRAARETRQIYEEVLRQWRRR